MLYQTRQYVDMGIDINFIIHKTKI